VASYSYDYEYVARNNRPLEVKRVYKGNINNTLWELRNSGWKVLDIQPQGNSSYYTVIVWR